MARRLLFRLQGKAPMLDLFFRKYAWTANLALLFVAAWLSAKTVNTFVGAVIRPKPAVDLNLAAVPPSRPVLPLAMDETKLYHLIGQSPPKREEEAGATAAPSRPQNCQDPRATPVRSDLRLQLVATVIAERPSSSLATISDLSSRQTAVYGVGEQVGGAELLGLERVKDDGDATGNAFKIVAVICNGGTKEYLDFEGGGTADAIPPAGNIGRAPVPAPGFPGRPAAPVGGVRAVGPDKYTIDRNVIDSTLSNLNNIATQARIVPSFKNGVANGFKLFSIQPGSLYASIGIENGDVIQRINGYEINSPEKALELYQKLREVGHVTIDVERQGLPIRKQYDVTP
jgi:general secretion pathway protein C